MNEGLLPGEIEITVPGHGFIGNEKYDTGNGKQDEPGNDESEPVAFVCVRSGTFRPEGQVTDLNGFLGEGNAVSGSRLRYEPVAYVVLIHQRAGVDASVFGIRSFVWPAGSHGFFAEEPDRLVAQYEKPEQPMDQQV